MIGASISCIVPVFNGARYLGEALDSIISQTLAPTEIIVVDDGSTDDTANVARRFDARITYIHQPNAGPASARNRGVALATGAFLSFLDADDLWHEEKTARQMDRLASNPGADFCLTYLQNFWVDELAEERERMRDHDFAKPMPGYLCQCMLARRGVFDTVGGFNETKRLGEDTDWFLRAERAGIVKEILPDTLVSRRIHTQNMSYEVYQSREARADVLDLVVDKLKHRRDRLHS